MKQAQLLETIDLIREKSENGKLIIFVGSGVSRNVEGMPSWEDLVKAMAREIPYSKCDFCREKTADCQKFCSLKNSFSPDEFLKIPQYLFNKNHKRYETLFKENFKEVFADAPLSDAIFKLNPAHIITTNYDHLLENSSCALKHQYKVVVENKDLLDSNSSKYLIKMHGDLVNFDSIVLKEQDYLDFSQNKVLIELFVKALLADHTILFLGYSLSDYNIKLILSWLNFIRRQNNALKGKIIGYIALDNKVLNKTQITYFEKNSIKVLNLHEMPLIDNLPVSLLGTEGKRLYSFLKVIENPRLKRYFSFNDYIHNIYSQTSEFSFIPFVELLNLLKIQNYQRVNNTLCLFQKEDFALIQRICETDDFEDKAICKHLINNDIHFLSVSDQRTPFNPPKTYQFPVEYVNALFLDNLFKLYISNDIKKLNEELCRINDANIIGFYKQFYCFDINKLRDAYKEKIFDNLSPKDIMINLYNSGYVDSMPFSLNLMMAKAYYDSMSSRIHQNILSIYKEIFDNFNKRKTFLSNELEKLEDLYSAHSATFGDTLIHLYKIQDSFMEIYYFYFYNHLFYFRLEPIKTMAKLYAEAMLCTNGEVVKENIEFFGYQNKLERYAINAIDWDILTKFISTKDLVALLDRFHIQKLKMSIKNSDIINFFKNPVDSIELGIWGDAPFWSTLVNCYTLIAYIEFNNDERKEIEDILFNLLSCKKFINSFFSVNYPDFRTSLNPLVVVLKKIFANPHTELIVGILQADKFWDYFANVDRQAVRALFKALIVDSNQKTEAFLFDIIQAEANIVIKNKMLWLFYNSLTQPMKINILKDEINKNWLSLDLQMRLELILSDWIIVDDEKTKYIIEKTLKLDEKRGKERVQRFPDPFEINIESLCILILCDKIADTKPLLQLKHRTAPLDFLLSPETFDYSQVDFSNYMWQNCARNNKYLPYFINAKEKIIPQIKKRIELNKATEFEKKMLYGIFMRREEVLD